MARARREAERRQRRAGGQERDPTFYPTTKKMGEQSLQRWIIELLRPLVERWFAERGKPTFVGADQFIYYEQYNPKAVVAPDVYVMPGFPPGKSVPSWKVWETSTVPSFVLEVVSTKWKTKDYTDAPVRYDVLGVKEFLLFDPEPNPKRGRVRWQRYRRLKSRGFVRVEATNNDRIFSRVLGCWLRAVGEGEQTRVRLATGEDGEILFPTAEEAEREAREAERAAREAERAAREAEHAVAERERLAKEEALRRVAELEAALASVTGKR